MGLGDDLTYAQQLAQNADPAGKTALDKLNTQLSAVYSSLTNLNATQTNALFRQNDIRNIIDTEAGRLQSKQEQVDQAAKNQKRLIYFNDNSRKIYAAYLKILITLVITLGIVWLIRIIHFHFGSFIPEFITNISTILTVSIGVIIMYNYYIAIRSRDMYNFDELKFDPPAPLATPSPSPLPATSKISGSGMCAGSYCCSSTTVWDSNQGVCVQLPQGTSAPTSMLPTGTTPPTSAFTLMYEPFEEYGKL